MLIKIKWTKSMTFQDQLEKYPKVFSCEVYSEVKHSSKPFPDAKNNTASSLEVVVSDLTGPFIPSLTGKKYLITFTDTYMRYMWTYAIKDKSETYELTCKWLQTVQAFGKVQVFRSDNGGEYSSQ